MQGRVSGGPGLALSTWIGIWPFSSAVFAAGQICLSLREVCMSVASIAFCIGYLSGLIYGAVLAMWAANRLRKPPTRFS